MLLSYRSRKFAQRLYELAPAIRMLAIQVDSYSEIPDDVKSSIRIAATWMETAANELGKATKQ